MKVTDALKWPGLVVASATAIGAVLLYVRDPCGITDCPLEQQVEAVAGKAAEADSDRHNLKGQVGLMLEWQGDQMKLDCLALGEKYDAQTLRMLGKWCDRCETMGMNICAERDSL